MFPTNATGGAGSYPTDLLGTLVYGINRAIDGYASKEFGGTKADENQAINAQGQYVPEGAPGATSLTSALSNPWVVGGAIAVVGLLVVLAVRK